MKRTTLVLEDACMDGVRDLARRERRQISEVVNQLLTEGLQRRKGMRRKAVELPSFAMGRPRVNLGDRNALEALMDGFIGVGGHRDQSGTRNPTPDIGLSVWDGDYLVAGVPDLSA